MQQVVVIELLFFSSLERHLAVSSTRSHHLHRTSRSSDTASTLFGDHCYQFGWTCDVLMCSKFKRSVVSVCALCFVASCITLTRLTYLFGYVTHLLHCRSQLLCSLDFILYWDEIKVPRFPPLQMQMSSDIIFFSIHETPNPSSFTRTFIS